MPGTDPYRDVDPRVVQASLRDARPAVYWTDRPERPDPEPPLTGSHRGDPAIMAKQDDPSADVVVLEGGRLGHGASGRNGGFVSPSLTHGLAQGAARWPAELPVLERLGKENFVGLQRFLTDHDVQADFHVPGELTFSMTEHQDSAVRATYDLHRRHGDQVTWLDRADCRARVDSPLYRCGFFEPDIALVDPGLLVFGLAQVARRLGVRLHELSPVTGITRDGAGLRLQTARGDLRADRVVLGTNAFRGLLRRFRAFVLPVYDHVLMSEPLTRDQLTSIGWEGREGLTDAGNQFHYYRRTLDDRVLFGGFDANYHYGGRINPVLEQSSSHDLLARHFFAIFPQLSGVRFTHRWGGVIDTTSRFTPIFGTAHQGRLSYAVGYTGLGVGSSRFGARVALDLVHGRDTEATRLSMVRSSPIPFPPEPLRSAVVRATRASLAAEDRTGRRSPWLRVLDRFGIGFDT
jgi:glycine/D-amino acid oxidase-like deaminating enzyme